MFELFRVRKSMRRDETDLDWIARFNGRVRHPIRSLKVWWRRRRRLSTSPLGIPRRNAPI